MKVTPCKDLIANGWLRSIAISYLLLLPAASATSKFSSTLTTKNLALPPNSVCAYWLDAKRLFVIKQFYVPKAHFTAFQAFTYQLSTGKLEPLTRFNLFLRKYYLTSGGEFPFSQLSFSPDAQWVALPSPDSAFGSSVFGRFETNNDEPIGGWRYAFGSKSYVFYNLRTNRCYHLNFWGTVVRNSFAWMPNSRHWVVLVHTDRATKLLKGDVSGTFISQVCSTLQVAHGGISSVLNLANPEDLQLIGSLDTTDNALWIAPYPKSEQSIVGRQRVGGQANPSSATFQERRWKIQTLDDLLFACQLSGNRAVGDQALKLLDASMTGEFVELPLESTLGGKKRISCSFPYPVRIVRALLSPDKQKIAWLTFLSNSKRVSLELWISDRSGKGLKRVWREEGVFSPSTILTWQWLPDSKGLSYYAPITRANQKLLIHILTLPADALSFGT
jgi:hypothetical protein